MKRIRSTIPLLLIIIFLSQCDLTDPGPPTYYNQFELMGNTTGDDGNRGSVQLNEVMWAGSYEGSKDVAPIAHPDDVFIELYNEDYRAINLTGWHFIVKGSVNKTFRIPADAANPPIIQAGGFLVVARTRSKAWTGANSVIGDLEIPRLDYEITLKDADLRLIDSLGREHGDPFAGCDDMRSARSMERTKDLFNDDGDLISSWHTYDEDLARGTINPQYAFRTFASPGELNSDDYGLVPDESNEDDTLIQ